MTFARIGLRLFHIGVFIFCASMSLAGGFESGGLGARATGMGGAFVGLADDWTAIYWNPAGLAHNERNQVGASLEYVRVLAHDSQGLTNFVPPPTQTSLQRGDIFTQLGGEPVHFFGQDSHFSAFLPGVGFSWTHNGWTFGGGSYSPLGFAFEVRDRSQPSFDVSYKSQGYIMNHNLLSVARKLFSTVSVGAGVNLVQSRLGRYANKKTATYESSISATMNSLDLQGVFGTVVQLGRYGQAGAVFRTGQDIRLHGHADIIDGRFPVESSAVQQTIRNPTTYGVGLAVFPLQKLTITIDWQRTEWSASRHQIHFDRPGTLLQDQAFDVGWRTTNRYRFGTEWRPTERWAIRAGYFRDPRAVSYGSQALTGLIDPEMCYVTSGLSYRYLRWNIHLSNQYGVGKEMLPERTLRKEVYSLTLGFDYFL